MRGWLSSALSISEWSGASLPWSAELAGLKERLGGFFHRSETRAQVGLYLDGLISGVERKNGWQLAEHAGDEAHWRMQAVLGRGFWDGEQAPATFVATMSWSGSAIHLGFWSWTRRAS